VLPNEHAIRETEAGCACLAWTFLKSHTSSESNRSFHLTIHMGEGLSYSEHYQGQEPSSPQTGQSLWEPLAPRPLHAAGSQLPVKVYSESQRKAGWERGWCSVAGPHCSEQNLAVEPTGVSREHHTTPAGRGHLFTSPGGERGEGADRRLRRCCNPTVKQGLPKWQGQG
jgi:hypothetical protein